MIKYSQDFIERVKKAYPLSESLHKALDCGSEIVGRYLDDSTSDTISISTVLAADSLDSLKQYCRDKKTKLNLSREWYQIRDKELDKR
jgi:hypothetical protein